MKNKITSLVVIVFTLLINDIKAQSSVAKTDSFYNVTRNKAWMISKCVIASNQSDKKSLFSNTTFRFNQIDSVKFLVEMPGKPNLVGGWTKQGINKILFSIPLIKQDSTTSSNDSLYNEGVKFLCSWPLQKIELQSSLLKFKIVDPMRGEMFIEFSRKE